MVGLELSCGHGGVICAELERPKLQASRNLQAMSLTDSDVDHHEPEPKLRRMNAHVWDGLTDSDADDVEDHSPTSETTLILPGLVPEHKFKMAEVFSGCGVLAGAMENLGFGVLKYDFMLGGAAHDISNCYTASCLLQGFCLVR